MGNLNYIPQDIAYSELENAFFNAYTELTSWDPQGRREYRIPDWLQCGSAAFTASDIVHGLKIMYQKMHIIHPSDQLAQCIQRHNIKKTKLRHYKNILPNGNELDFTARQLEHRGEIAPWAKEVYNMSVADIWDILAMRKTAESFIQRYDILRENVIRELALLFTCKVEDIQEYLAIQKFRLTECPCNHPSEILLLDKSLSL